MRLSAPAFDSIAAFKQALQDVSGWLPVLHAIAERHDLVINPARVEVGIGGTYPTFLVDDVVIKLFGHLPRWQDAFRAELAVMQFIGQDPSLAAPRLLGSGEIFDAPSPICPYMLTSRMAGVAWDRATLSAADKIRLAEDLGVQLAKLGALDCAEVDLTSPADAPSLAAAARRSSLPQHLVPEIDTFAARLQQTSGATGQQRLVHGDLMFRHVFVEHGRCSGLIDWGDALVIDPHYELVQIQLNLFDRDQELLRVMLAAAGWSPAPDFAERCLLMSLQRQAHGLAQHFSMDVFYKIPQWIAVDRVSSLEELAQRLFGKQ
jgi:aminoglycoside phosphotransferase (APT) family kinase protein